MREETPFDASLLGGAVERRYRKARPEVEALPWGTLGPSLLDAETRRAGGRAWTISAFQEHRTAAACAETVSALVAARAPLDLVAMATRFPLDEIVHVELCVRLANELGGGPPLLHDATELIPRPPSPLPPLVHAADLVVRYFSVGEAISVPLLRATWHATEHPLTRGVLGCIVKDEAAHGVFGWMFLDWANEQLTHAERLHLRGVATEAIADLRRSWRHLERRRATASAGRILGWLEPREYIAVAEGALAANVVAPLRERGLLDA